MPANQVVRKALKAFMRIPTCRETSALLSRRQDRPLGLLERAGLYLHLAVCAGCREFRRQLAFMHTAFRRYLDRGD